MKFLKVLVIFTWVGRRNHLKSLPCFVPWAPITSTNFLIHSKNCKTKNYLKPFKRTRWMCVGWMLLLGCFYSSSSLQPRLPKNIIRKGERIWFFSAQKNLGALQQFSEKNCFFSKPLKNHPFKSACLPMQFDVKKVFNATHLELSISRALE